MTLSRQLRHKDRARRAAEPFRFEALCAALAWYYDNRRECLVYAGGAPPGRIQELNPGVRVVVEGTNIPWRRIKGVVPWPLPEHDSSALDGPRVYPTVNADVSQLR